MSSLLLSAGLEGLSALNKIKKEEDDCKMALAKSELVVRSYSAWRRPKMDEEWPDSL